VYLYLVGSRLRRLRPDRWRLIFLFFAAIYASLLLMNLAYMAIQWDETPHLYGALLLSQGRFQEYLSSTRYPPMLDITTAFYFKIFGPSAYTGRIVSITFALLTLWAIFELAYRIYGPKIALLASVLLGTMPAFVWLSRVTLIEMMLEFFFLASMLFFLFWLRTSQNKALILSGVALGLGFLTKYQMLAAGIVMITSLLLLCRDNLKAKLSRFSLLIMTAVAIALPWIVIIYQIYTSGILDQWLSLLQMSDTRSHLYSQRYPLPIFYLIEMTWPYGLVHPISLLVYILGFLGLCLFIWRRKTEDKFFLIWFFVVYVFFTFVGIKDWRFIMPVFPVLAISAASFVSFAYSKAEKAWKSGQVSLNKKRVVKIAAVCLIVFTGVAIIYSTVEAYRWVAKDEVYVPIREATHYAAERLNDNKSVMVVCPLNFFNRDMVRFYLGACESKQNQVWQYPDLPVDAYTPNFDVSKLIALCEEQNVKYLLLFEYGMTYPYFNSTLTPQAVYEMLNQCGKFTYQTSFGTYPCRIFILCMITHALVNSGERSELFF
jgi:4-amino-4-deoxy-L-arabinose transferase-like glycosyltransferase